jgi:integrase/recombinase XerD
MSKQTIINYQNHHTMLDDIIYHFRKELQNLGYGKTIIDHYPKYVQNLLNFTHELPENTTQEQIKNYYAYLKEKPKQVGKGIISPSHVKSQLLAIRLFFEYLERIQKIKQNPFTLKIKSPVTQIKTVLTQEEIQKLYKNCKSIEERIILNLCYGCGLRRNEVVNLNYNDINQEKKLVFIRKGKGKKRRVIPITQSIIEDVKKYQRLSKNYRIKEEESFLINHQGFRMSGGSIYDIFKKLLQRTSSLNDKDYCLHSLRHSIATHLLENEMSMEMVRDFLGHQQLATTQIYTRINLFKMKLQQ